MKLNSQTTTYAVTLVLVAGCGAADPPPLCAELEFFYEDDNLSRMTALSDGYVLDFARYAVPGLEFAVVGYGMDNAPRFRIEGRHLAFAGTDADELVTVTRKDDAVQLLAWSNDGAPLGERGRLEGNTATGAVVLAGGQALVWGGEDAQEWVGTIASDSPSFAEHTGGVNRWDAVASADGGAFALDQLPQVGRSPASGLPVRGRIALSRLSADGDAAWTTILVEEGFGHVDVALVGSADGDAFVWISEVLDRERTALRRYDAEGRLIWSVPQAFDSRLGAPGVVARQDGTIVLVDGAGPDNIRTIRLRFLDDQGEVAFASEVPSNSRSVFDLELIDDELFVVTPDRVSRIRLGDSTQCNERGR